jgi:hypothetical protein
MKQSRFFVAQTPISRSKFGAFQSSRILLERAREVIESNLCCNFPSKLRSHLVCTRLAKLMPQSRILQ